MRRAVFLDRDGTIIVHKPYLADPDEVELVAGAPEALARLKQGGFLLIVITNQSVIGRGWATVEQVDAVNARVAELYAAHGIAFDGHYYCPHAPEDGCDCRKPQPGLLLQAADDHDIDLAGSYMVGDNPTDIGAARNAGVRRSFFLIGDSHLFSEAPDDDAVSAEGVTVAADMAAVAEAILAAS